MSAFQTKSLLYSHVTAAETTGPTDLKGAIDCKGFDGTSSRSCAWSH